MPTIADNFNLEANEPLDARTQWPTVQAALQGIKPGQRTTAMFVRILAGGGQWYSFQGGLANENFKPAPFEQLKQYYSQLPTPDTVRDVQDIPIGTCATFRLTPPEAGWIPVVPGQQFDRVTYPTLYAALGSDRLPDETSMEGNVYIKVEQISIARTDAMTPFELVGGVYDQKIANMLAQLNTLLADLNYNETVRKRILETTIGLPAVPTESLSTLDAWLTTFKRMLVSLLNGKYVAADRTEPFYDLIQKIGDIRNAEEQTNPGINVQCRIGEVAVQQDCPGPGWIESDGTLLDHPNTTGRSLLWPEYYDYFYNVLGYSISPLTLAVPTMTSNTAPCGQVRFYKGDGNKSVTITNPWHWFNRASNTPSLANTVYDWTDPEPLYLEYEFASGQKTYSQPKNIRRFGIVFSAVDASAAYPTSFTVQGYDPEIGLWIDLMTTEEFEATQTGKEYVFDFPNDHPVTSIRLKMTEGISSTSHSLYGIRDIKFYEYIPFRTPAVSTPQRKVWIKVATVGNDLGIKTKEYRVASEKVQKNDLVFLDDFSTTPTPGRSPFISGALNTGIGHSTQTSFDVADYEYEGTVYHFFGSAYAQYSSTSYYMISYFTDAIMNAAAKPTPKLCFPSTSSNSGTTGTPGRFFWHKEKLHFVAGCYHIWRLDHPEHLAASPTNAWVRVMNLNQSIPEHYNAQDVYHFNDGEEHYSYHVLNAAPWLKLFRWNLETFTMPVEVPMNPSMGLKNLSRSGVTLHYHFFRHRGTLYFICWDQSDYRLKMFRQDAPETMTLLKSQKLPFTPTSVTAYFAFPVRDDVFLWNNKYVFCCGYQHSGHTPLSGTINGVSSNVMGLYDFDANEFEFPEMKTYIGYKLVAHEYSSFYRIVKILDDYYLFSTAPATLMRIDMDRRVLVKGEPIQSSSFSLGTFNDVFHVGGRYILHFSGSTGIVFDFGRPRVLSQQDFQKLGSGKQTGRSLVAVETATKNQMVRCQELALWPLQMNPQLASGPPGLGAWSDYILPKRET